MDLFLRPSVFPTFQLANRLKHFGAILHKYFPSIYHAMEGVLAKLNPGLSWQKLHLTRRKIFLPPN
jgi:hypothetical protein